MADRVNEVLHARRGRPRNEEYDRAILETALDQVAKVGFRAVSVESIATAVGVGKPTIYRRWPNKAAVVMDAFLWHMAPQVANPDTPRALESLRAHLRSQVRLFRGKSGECISSLLAEAQFDQELKEAIRERWLSPSRELARKTIAKAIEQGDLRSDLDVDVVVDLLHGALFFQLQLGTERISEAYADEIMNSVLKARPRRS
jgi:AcrR family transcriptional regulator